ncbi:PKD domain-containing protein [Methanospirillum stamsii]|nr:PKD domain-containing protein [Methanospirillum stamsii]
MRDIIQHIIVLFIFSLFVSLCCTSVDAITAKASIAPVQGPVPLNVMFTDISEGTPVEWHWDFGDGFTGDGPGIIHTYISPGTYTIKLMVLDEKGFSDTVIFENIIIAYSNPFMPVIPVTIPSFSADFTGQPQSGPAPLSVTFTDLSKGEPSTWIWDFGDGTTSNIQNPEHVYSNPGTYSVVLKISKGTSTGMKERKYYIKVLESAAIFSDEFHSEITTPIQKTATSALDIPESNFIHQEVTEQKLLQASDNECDSGLTFSSETELLNQREIFSLKLKGNPLERVYLWITQDLQPDLEKSEVYPRFMNEDFLYDEKTGPYTIGSFIPNTTTGLSIIDTIPEKTGDYFTAYYGLVALDKNGEQDIVIDTSDSSPGIYAVHALSGDNSASCIKNFIFTIN